LARSTLGLLWKALHAALRRALEPEPIARHSMAVVRKRLPTGAAPEAKVIGAEAVADLLDRASGTPYHSAILLASACGLRRGEACGLLWRNVDFKAKELTIDQARVLARKGIATGKTKIRPCIALAAPDHPGGAIVAGRRQSGHQCLRMCPC
jgi:integrase